MFGREKKKEIDSMTIEEIEKYLEERKSNEESEQTLKDRVDESVGEQEKETDSEDSQTAKDRVDESLGEEKELEEEIAKRKTLEFYEKMAEEYSDNPRLAELVGELKELGA